jgi:sulfur relay (sulfurtransferase) DsrC/TusE family protein
MDHIILLLTLLGIIVCLTLIYKSKQSKKKDDYEEVSLKDIIDYNDKTIDADKDGHILISEVYKNTEEEVLEKILSKDKNFSKEHFINFVKEYFVIYEKAISNRDVKKLHIYESDSLYREHIEKVEELKRHKIISNREKIVIKGVLLKDFKIEGNKQILTVAITAKLTSATYKENATPDDIEYQVDEKHYLLKYMRNIDTMTIDNISNKIITNCPNCGANIKTDEECHCSYCGTIINSGKYDWTLLDFMTIKIDGPRD